MDRSGSGSKLIGSLVAGDRKFGMGHDDMGPVLFHLCKGSVGSQCWDHVMDGGMLTLKSKSSRAL